MFIVENMYKTISKEIKVIHEKTQRPMATSSIFWYVTSPLSLFMFSI